MSSCYRFQEIKYTAPIFKEVQATYIIHLEGNGRLPAIQEQLKKYHPTETVYILWNKGFKKCKKDLAIDKSPLDLVDAFMQCFKDANEKGYEHILILEDDFIFDEKILEPCHVRSIEAFLKSKEGDNYVYYLGTAPVLQFSTFGHHNRSIISGGTHSVIYPKTFIKHVLTDINQYDIVDWDFYTNLYCTQYKYYIPLCYQLFPKTDNQNNWGVNFFEKLFIVPIIYFIPYFKLDKQYQPGYDILEFSSKFIIYFATFTYILLFIFTYLFIKKNYRNIKQNYYYVFILFIAYISYFIFLLITYILSLIFQRFYYIGFT
jgi:hypothetical protein